MFCYFFYHMVSNGISVWEITSLQWCVGGWLARGLTQAIQSLKKARITFIWGGEILRNKRRSQRLMWTWNAPDSQSECHLIVKSTNYQCTSNCTRFAFVQFIYEKKNYENKVYASNWFSNKQTKTKNKRRKKKIDMNPICVAYAYVNRTICTLYK